MNRELRLASDLKSEFLATVSHELRTPLNVILGYVEMLREQASESLDADQRAMLQAIDRYSRLQLDLVTSVLDFTRLVSGRISLWPLSMPTPSANAGSSSTSRSTPRSRKS